MSSSPLVDPVVTRIAATHQRTAAQILVQWHWGLGIPVNPRSMNQTHMEELLTAYDFTLSSQEMEALSSRPQDTCTVRQRPQARRMPCLSFLIPRFHFMSNSWTPASTSALPPCSTIPARPPPLVLLQPR